MHLNYTLDQLTQIKNGDEPAITKFFLDNEATLRGDVEAQISRSSIKHLYDVDKIASETFRLLFKQLQNGSVSFDSPAEINLGGILNAILRQRITNEYYHLNGNKQRPSKTVRPAHMQYGDYKTAGGETHSWVDRAVTHHHPHDDVHLNERDYLPVARRVLGVALDGLSEGKVKDTAVKFFVEDKSIKDLALEFRMRSNQIAGRLHSAQQKMLENCGGNAEDEQLLRFMFRARREPKDTHNTARGGKAF
jgi:hypothetical protein